MNEMLNKKIILHKDCGKNHVDKGEFAKFNHRKHLCEHCKKFFIDTEKGVGV